MRSLAEFGAGAPMGTMGSWRNLRRSFWEFDSNTILGLGGGVVAEVLAATGASCCEDMAVVASYAAGKER